MKNAIDWMRLSWVIKSLVTLVGFTLLHNKGKVQPSNGLNGIKLDMCSSVYFFVWEKWPVKSTPS